MNSIPELGRGGDIPEWDLADRLVKARRHAGVEQAEMASYLGLSRAAVSDFERAKRPPRRVYLLGWASRCGVNLDWLVGQASPDGDGPPSPSTKWYEPNGLRLLRAA